MRLELPPRGLSAEKFQLSLPRSGFTLTWSLKKQSRHLWRSKWSWLLIRWSLQSHLNELVFWKDIRSSGKASGSLVTTQTQRSPSCSTEWVCDMRWMKQWNYACYMRWSRCLRVCLPGLNSLSYWLLNCRNRKSSLWSDHKYLTSCW